MGKHRKVSPRRRSAVWSAVTARRASRSAGGLAVCAALLPVSALPIAGAVTMRPMPSPATVLAISPFGVPMSNELQGAVCQSSNTCTAVGYLPFVTPTGVTALEATLSETSASKIVIFGYSNGAQVAQSWLTQHLDDPNAPSPEVLSFVLIGNPTRAFGGHPDASEGVVWPQSGYQVIDIAQQYDAAADYPNNPASPNYFLAVINAYAGFFSAPHLDYSNVDINDPANAVWKVGNITYVLAPTQNVPLLGGLAPLFPALNAQLKDQIETAYIRPVPFPTAPQPSAPTTPLAASALPTSMAADPTVSRQQNSAPSSLAATAPAPTDAAPTATESTNISTSGKPTGRGGSGGDRADGGIGVLRGDGGQLRSRPRLGLKETTGVGGTEAAGRTGSQGSNDTEGSRPAVAGQGAGSTTLGSAGTAGPAGSGQ